MEARIGGMADDGQGGNVLSECHVGGGQRLMLVGGAVGLAAALALGRFAQSLLYEIDGTDPAIIAAALLGLGAHSRA